MEPVHTNTYLSIPKQQRSFFDLAVAHTTRQPEAGPAIQPPHTHNCATRRSNQEHTRTQEHMESRMDTRNSVIVTPACQAAYGACNTGTRLLIRTHAHHHWDMYRGPNAA